MKRKHDHDNPSQDSIVEEFASIAKSDFIDQESFDYELGLYILALNIYEKMSQGSSLEQNEAAFQSFRINKLLIPALCHSYALSINDGLKSLGENNKLNLQKVPGEKEQEVEKLKSHLLSIPKRSFYEPLWAEVAKAYELIADLQYDCFMANEKKSLKLLQRILNNYSESLKIKFHVPVWLSVINTRRLLIEKYKKTANNSYLKELDAIIDEITNFSAELNENCLMIMISHLLYACVNGYQLNHKQQDVYVQRAFNFIKNHLILLVKNQGNEAYEDIYEPIINHLKILGINEKTGQLEPNSTIEACIQKAKNSSDFDLGTLISSPEEIETKEKILVSMGLKNKTREDYLLDAKNYMSQQQQHLKDSLESVEENVKFSPEKIEPISPTKQSMVKKMPFFNKNKSTTTPEELKSIHLTGNA